MSNENFTWDMSGGLPLLVQDGAASYLYGPGGLLIEQVTSGGTAYYAYTDELGEVWS